MPDPSPRLRVQRWIRRQAGDELFRRMAGGAALAFLIKIATAGLSFVMFVLFARAMGDATYGRFAFALSLANWVALIAGLGLHVAVMRLIPQYEAHGDPGRAREALHWGTRLTRVSGLAAGLGLAAAAALGLGGWSVLAAALLTPALASAAYAAGALRAEGRVAAALVPRDILWRIFGCALGGAAVASGVDLSATDALLPLAAALAALTFWQTRRLRGIAGAPERGFLADLRDTRRAPRRGWLAVAAPICAATAFGSSMEHFDVVLAGALLSPVEAGRYFAALKVAGLLGLASAAANIVATPAIARHFHRGERRELQKSLRVAALCVTAATVPTLAAAVVFAEPLLGLFGDGFAEYGGLLIALAVGIALNGLFGPTGPLLMMIGRTGTLLRILAASQAAALALQLSLAPAWGVWGIAAGAVAGAVLRNVASWRACRRAAGVDTAATCLVQPLAAALGRGREKGAS